MATKAKKHETLFLAGPKAKLTRKLEMLESCDAREAASQRFILAGMVATFDSETLAVAVTAVSAAVRKRLAEMPDDS